MVTRTFFQRFGTQGICVLPCDVLSDDLLTDPETGEELPSLREQVSLVDGIYQRVLCYAHVLKVCGDGLYWADVAATPDFVNVYRVILSEEDLYPSLPYDIRVQGKSPAHILKLMAAHAHEVKPVQRLEPIVTPALTAAPVLPLEPLAEIEVSNDELQEAIGLVTIDTLKDTQKRRLSRPIGSFRMQQAFLRVIVDALMTQLYRAQEFVRISSIRLQCATAAYLQRWHRQSRQRCVNAVPVWNSQQNVVMWQLTVGDPLTALAAA